jgi:hypothetical protein
MIETEPAGGVVQPLEGEQLLADLVAHRQSRG